MGALPAFLAVRPSLALGGTPEQLAYQLWAKNGGLKEGPPLGCLATVGNVCGAPEGARKPLSPPGCCPHPDSANTPLSSC